MTAGPGGRGGYRPVIRKQVEAHEPSTTKSMRNLSKKAFGRWHERLADLYATPDPQQVPELLMQAVGELLDFDTGLICVMGKSIRPIAIYDDVHAELRKANVDAYYAGAYLLDPLYQAGVEHSKPGLYRLKEIAPPGFRQSEYFRRYFRDSGMSDEVVALTYLPGDLFMHTAFSIYQGSPPMDKNRIEWLKLAGPLIERILVKYWREFAERKARGTSRLSTELGEALELFGASQLTERESEIVRLYLKGHGTRSIADRLDISQHTVSMHRKNAYGKLDVSSQGELFHLFIDSLGCFDPARREDPLLQYLSPSKPR